MTNSAHFVMLHPLYKIIQTLYPIVTSKKTDFKRMKWKGKHITQHNYSVSNFDTAYRVTVLLKVDPSAQSDVLGALQVFIKDITFLLCSVFLLTWPAWCCYHASPLLCRWWDTCSLKLNQIGHHVLGHLFQSCFWALRQFLWSHSLVLFWFLFSAVRPV